MLLLCTASSSQAGITGLELTFSVKVQQYNLSLAEAQLGSAPSLYYVGREQAVERLGEVPMSRWIEIKR